MNRIVSKHAILFLAIIPSLIISMDYPQLQLTEQKIKEREKKTVQIMMPSYAASGYYFGYQKPEFENYRFNLPQNSPIFVCAITLEKEEQPIVTFLPAQYFYNCNDDSLLDVPYVLDQDANELFNLSLVCKRNADIAIELDGTPVDLQNKSFRKQFNSLMKFFYQSGALLTRAVIGSQNIDRLIEDNIVTKIRLADRQASYPDPTDNQQRISINLPTYTFAHGPQGCPTKECFKGLMLENAKKLYGKNTFNYVMGRQIGRPLPK